MTRAELDVAVRRHIRSRLALMNSALVVLLGVPAAGVHFDLDPEIIIIGTLVVPFLLIALTIPLQMRLAPRCPNCQAPLGLEKKRFYDVVSTGRCRQGSS